MHRLLILLSVFLFQVQLSVQTSCGVRSDSNRVVKWNNPPQFNVPNTDLVCKFVGLKDCYGGGCIVRSRMRVRRTVDNQPYGSPDFGKAGASTYQVETCQALTTQHKIVSATCYNGSSSVPLAGYDPISMVIREPLTCGCVTYNMLSNEQTLAVNKVKSYYTSSTTPSITTINH